MNHSQSIKTTYLTYNGFEYFSTILYVTNTIHTIAHTITRIGQVLDENGDENWLATDLSSFGWLARAERTRNAGIKYCIPAPA